MMENASAKQAMLQRIITRALDNFKKIGKSNWTPAKIRSRIHQLDEAWDEFQKAHATLLSVKRPDDEAAASSKLGDQLETTEDAYSTARDFMADCLANLEPTVSQLNSSSAPPSGTVTPCTSSVSLAHLPPVQLPPFDRDCNEWETFRDRFTALILANPELSDFVRMHFLVSSLKGRALDAIKTIPLTAENLAIAWRTLSARFENKRRLIQVHMSSLIGLTAVKRESPEELRALVDRSKVAVASLAQLGRTPAELWSDILVHLVSHKLDPSTLKAWTLATPHVDEMPSFENLTRFVESRARALEELAPSLTTTPIMKSTGIQRVHAANVTARRGPDNLSTPTDTNPKRSSCPRCNARHYLSSCPSFLAEAPSRRREFVIRANRCFNCLSDAHTVADCHSQYTCRRCHKKHHSILHDDSESPASGKPIMPTRASAASMDNDAVTSLSANTHSRTSSRILLATALIKVSVSTGRSAVVRALLDQGSEATFISENLAQLLSAKRTRKNVEISAVGDIRATTVRHAVSITVCSRYADVPAFNTTALVLRTLTSYPPPRHSDSPVLDIFADLPWADADPTGNEPIQVIIGADLYGAVLRDGLRKGRAGMPVAQNTIFGWVISGPVQSPPVPSHPYNCVTTRLCAHVLTLEDELRRFWEVEELPRKAHLTTAETKCEEHFRATHSRAPDGRFIVRLPLTRDPPLDLGPTRPAAEKMLGSLFRKFRTNSDLEREYSEFITEYERFGHMTLAPASHHPSESIYIPHHPVFRTGSATTHLRVVFNASYRTSTGRSLNDYLLAGPKLQTDLSAVVLRWRHHRYVYAADIEKMYRQIRVDPRDADYQRILWEKTPSGPIREYRLLTVTYGMTCAPFLALRVLKRLVELDGHQFPLAAPILQEQIYVDDVLFGGEDMVSLRQSRDQVIALLRRGKFELRKWASNSTSLLADIDPSNHGLACTKALGEDEKVKVLGIGWNPSRDVFQITVSTDALVPMTKRTILSTIAKLYDPLGWVTPVTVSAKIFIQDLWRLRASWDDPIPPAQVSRWTILYSGLRPLNGLTIDRWTGITTKSVQIELHGFADASNVAYAAVVYLKATSATGAVSVSLLAGKSRVAPITPLTIPRLELSAAVLLARLIEFVRGSLGARSHSCFCWTDSTVVLAWLRGHPSRWNTFVANRVHEVATRVPQAEWRHVPTQDNPADCASRALLGHELNHHHLWWHGPPWLRFAADQWPREAPLLPAETPLEERVTRVHCVMQTDQWELASRYSSWPKLIRVTAYVQLFIAHCRHRKRTRRPPHATGPALTAAQCLIARTFWVKTIQQTIFAAELQALSNNQPVSTRSATACLNPFLDANGIIRVGGRIRNAPVQYHRRHPVLLAAHPLVTLIIEQAHQRTLHGGPQLTLSTLRSEFWILRARSLVKLVIHRCVTCVRMRARVPEQMMGDLPPSRVTPPDRSFVNCGLDYAGPVKIRASAGRGITSRKAYIALFVCLATRAIHLELVSDYTTAAFRNAFSRFCARRGLPTSVYSDNGPTFVGADRELVKAYRAALRDPSFQNTTAGDNVSWHFIPPTAPHFGGLWEAGVRSVKHHLRRVLGEHTLTFEEFTTLLCRVEACLNSRPLAPLSDALDDYEPLTPGHFLIGAALNSAPEPSVLHITENRLSRWQLVQRMTEGFWKRWQLEYVNTLQQRTRWRQIRPSLELGQLVLLRNSTLPPCKWELGRIVQLHPGADGLLRVVTVRTATSEFKRPIVKLCALPVKSDISA